MTSVRAFVSHRLVRQAFSIAMWQAVSRVFTFIGSVWAMRCLGPEKLGISSVILAIVMALNILITLNLDILFVRQFKNEKTNEQRQSLISAVTLWRLTVALLFCALSLSLLLWLHIPQVWLLGIICAYPLLIVTSTQATWLLMAEENMPANSRALALQSFLIGVCYLIFFRPGQRVGSDIAVMAVATAAGWFYGWRTALGTNWRISIFATYVRKVWPLIVQGRWLILTGLIIYVYTNLELPLLAAMVPLSALGKYRTAFSLAGVVGQLLAIVPMLLYPRFIEWKNRDPSMFWSRQLKLASLSCVALLTASAFCFAFARPMYRLLYGEQFIEAAYPFALLVTSKFVILINGIFGWGLWAQGEDKKVFVVLGPVAVLSVTLNLLLIPKLGISGAATTNVISETLVLIGCFILSWQRVRRAAANVVPPEPPSMLF